MQFVFRKASQHVPNGYLTKDLGQWQLSHCPALPVSRIEDNAGNLVGFCLGRAVNEKGVLLEDAVRLPCVAATPEFLDHAERLLLSWAGRFALILSHCGRPYAYGDPACSYPLVYNREAKCIASSVLLAIEDELVPTPQYDVSSIVGYDPRALYLGSSERGSSSGGFCFDQTSDARVARLVSNHRLSLETFETSRIWPRSADKIGVLGPAEAAKIIAAQLAKVTNALAKTGPVHFALSGGFDSRMLIAAAAKDGLHENIALHSHAMNWATSLDAKSATKIGAKLERPVHVVEPPDGRKGSFRHETEQVRAALRHDLSTGFCGTLNDHIARGALEWIPKDSLWMRGNMLELATARFWPRPGRIPRPDDIEHAVQRCQISVVTEAQAEARYDQMQAWAASLPRCLQSRLHDASYIENFLPNGQPALLSVNHVFYVAPACNREVFKACMAVHPVRRLRQRLYRQIIRHARPDLLNVPMSREIAAKNRAKKQQRQIG
ncbi:MAG: hypothetical protein AAF922_10005 [Pseudomonadota bacterium]